MSWQSKELGAIVTLQRGFDLASSRRIPGKYPVISAGNTVGTHNERKVKGPGFAIGRATNLGKPQWSDSDYWPLNTTLFAKDFHGNNPRWLFHLFEVLDLTGFDSGTVQPMLNRNYIAKIKVSVPPLREQEAIADVLGALDDKIAANQRVMKLSDELIHAEYRRIDEYVVIPFTELRITNGAPFTGAHFNSHGEGFPLIRIRDLKTNTPQVWTTEQRTDSTEIQPGDLLVGLDAEFRPTTWLGAPGLLNQRMMKVSSEFYGSALLREAIRRPLAEIENYKTGTTVIHLNLMDLKQATVKVPKDSAVATIRSRMDSVYEAMVAKAQENQVLARTRDELLPLLMNGKISVAEASEAVEEVVGKHKEGDGDV